MDGVNRFMKNACLKNAFRQAFRERGRLARIWP